jgi:hypothetical protein
MQPEKPMSVRSKAILMNAAIMTGLILQHRRGAPLFVVAASGIFIFVIANLLMIFAAKKRTVARG